MENKNQRKKQSLLTGAGVLAIATILVKIIGALYKIPLTNLITVEGYAYFQGAYAVYNPLYAISMAGLPIAVSKLVSQNMQQGRVKDAQRIFSVSRKLFLLVGLAGTLILAAIAIPYSRLVGSEMNYVSILVIAPCILFCCCMSSFRGYYEGLNNMTPTGVSQVIEAAVKLVFGLAATYVAFNYWLESYHHRAVEGVVDVFGVTVHNEAEALAAMYPYAAAVAILGVTLGSLFGLLYLFITYKIKGFGFTRTEIAASPLPESDKKIRKDIIRLALPIALSSLILNVSNMIDDLTIRTRLAVALENGMDIIKEAYGASFAQAQTLDDSIANYLYGIHGSVLNIKNLIPTITLTLGISAIPVLSKAWSKIKDSGNVDEGHKELKTSIESVLRVTMMLALPAGFGIAALASPILKLLYSSQPDILPIATPMMVVYGIGMFVLAVSSPITNMLQAIGRTDMPLKSIAIGSAVKIGLNFLLIARPEINIHGAPISTTVCYIVMVTINLTTLLRYTHVRVNFVSVFLKPFIAAALCGGTAYLAYWLLEVQYSFGNTVSSIVSIGAGGVIYVISLFIIKGIAKDDILMLPKGKNIAKTLEKFHILG